MLLIAVGVMLDRLRLSQPKSVAAVIGLAMFLLALIGFPLVGPLLGRPWLQAESFGLMPDPTVAATLGLLAAAQQAHWMLLVVPILWSAISGATLWAMQSPEAPLMPLAAAVAVVLVARKSWSEWVNR
jgi:hypothetical protein